MKLLILIFGLLILSGCSVQTCFDDCVDTYKDTNMSFQSSSCFGKGMVCAIEPSQVLKEYCFNRCYGNNSIRK